MQCFVFVAHAGSSVGQTRVDAVFPDRNIKIRDGAWFVAANKTADDVSDALGLGESEYGAVVAVGDLAGYAPDTVVDTLNRWMAHI